MSLVSLQGHLLIGDRLPNGKPGKMIWAGNVPEATLNLASEQSSKTESFSGQRQQYGELTTSNTATLSGVFDEWSMANLALGLYGTPLDVATGSVTAEAFPSGLIKGDVVVLDHPFASALAITDSAVTPAPLPPTKYQFTGHSQRAIELLDVQGFTQPFKAAYTFADAISLALFTQKPKEKYVVFDAVNTETDEPLVLDLYRTKFRPFENVGLIHQEYGNLPFTAAVLFDRLSAVDPVLGGFGRMLQKKAAG